MAAFVSLSSRDVHVLSRIRDTNSAAVFGVQLDPLLPKDPHITDADAYNEISQRERDIVLTLQQADTGLDGPEHAQSLDAYRQGIAQLDQLIDEHPDYASARNNRAQALRRLHGDDLLLEAAASTATGPSAGTTPPDRARAAATVLSDLDRCVALLMPASAAATPIFAAAALSPTAARTLSLACTQRATVYYATARRMSPERPVLAALARLEAQWTKLDFEEAASRDFGLGGRLGNDMARGLAIGTNPTAKLCGQMVQQMMKEYRS